MIIGDILHDPYISVYFVCIRIGSVFSQNKLVHLFFIRLPVSSKGVETFFFRQKMRTDGTLNKVRFWFSTIKDKLSNNLEFRWTIPDLQTQAVLGVRF